MKFRESLADFWEFAASLKSFRGWVVKASIAGPLVNLVSGLGPPWPSVAGVSICTAVVELVVLILTFELFGHGRVLVRRFRRALLISGLLAVSSMFSYMAIYGSFTARDPDDNTLVTKGFWRKADLQAALIEKSRPGLPKVAIDINALIPPNISDHDLLKLAGFDAHAVWDERTIHCVEIVLLVSWTGFFGFLCFCVGLFMILQRHHARA